MLSSGATITEDDEMVNPNKARMQKIRDEENNPEWQRKIGVRKMKDDKMEDVQEVEMPEGPTEVELEPEDQQELDLVEEEAQDERPKIPTHIGCGGEVQVDEDLDPRCMKCEKEIDPEEVTPPEPPECMYHTAEAGLDPDENCYAVGIEEGVPCLQVIVDGECPEPGGKPEPQVEGQSTLDGGVAEEPVYHPRIADTAIKHKFEIGSMKMAITISGRKVDGEVFKDLCQEFADRVQEEMM